MKLSLASPLHRLHKSQEWRRRAARSGFHLRMELRSEEEGMPLYLADLHQIPIGAGEDHALLLDLGDVGGIDLVAVPVPLHNLIGAIDPVRQAALLEVGGIIAQAHGRPHIPDLLLLRQ